MQAICYLIDKVRYEDTINIEIEHSHTQRINVRAQGAGSSIVSEPPIGNMIDFGTYFSGGTVKRIFMLTNKSSKPQNLSFQADENYPKNMSKKQIAKEREKLKVCVCFFLNSKLNYLNFFILLASSTSNI